MGLCRTGHFEFCVAVDDVLTLVALILTAADSHFELGAAVLEVELQGNERAALLQAARDSINKISGAR